MVSKSCCTGLCTLGQCHNFGFMYEKRQGGLLKIIQKAAKWYRKAAQQGNLTAQNNLGW